MKKLQRSTENKVIGGVCAGLADSFGIDPLFVRLGFILLGIITAIAPVIIAYLILWVLMPSKQD